VNKKGIR